MSVYSKSQSFDIDQASEIIFAETLQDGIKQAMLNSITTEFVVIKTETGKYRIAVINLKNRLNNLKSKTNFDSEYGAYKQEIGRSILTKKEWLGR